MCIRLQPFGEIRPIPLVPVRVPGRWAGCRRLEPPHRPAVRLVERMHATGPGPEDITGPERVAVAVRDDVDLTIEDVVRLFEGMVVRVRARARLVVDHEHRVELRVEPLVDE